MDKRTSTTEKLAKVHDELISAWGYYDANQKVLDNDVPLRHATQKRIDYLTKRERDLKRQLAKESGLES